MLYKIILTLILLLGVATLIAAQFSIPTLFGADGYLHMRMAQFIRENGVRYNFHWARYSTFAKNFADKDLLYHILLIPFASLPNMIMAGKITACLLTIFLYLVFFWMLKRYCATHVLIPVFLIVFLASAPFLQAISQTRNMVLVLALTLLFIHFLIQKNQWALFIVTILYALSHVSSPYLLVFAGLGELVRFINDREFQWRSLGTVAVGLVLGFLIHPNFPNNLLVFYLNGILVPIFALKWGLELGAEFFPVNTRDLVLDYPFIMIGLLVLLAMGISQKRKITTATAMWMIVTGFFFIFSFFSQRYIVHGYPLMLISLASYISDWWRSDARLPLLRRNTILSLGLIVSAVVVASLIGLRVYRDFRKLAQVEAVYNRHFETVGQWMAQNIPAGEVIFHSNWSDSQYFIGLNPQDDYFVTLDPIYMYYWNPKQYNLYRDIAFGRSPDPYRLLMDEFNCRWGYAGKNYFSGLINQIRTDTRFEVLAEDGLGLVFRLK
jgi:hypothetical protein